MVHAPMTPATTDLAIRADGLVKRFGDLVAVGGLDLAVPKGTCLGLLGPNGAGKTTTVNILVGLLKADEGDVEILGLGWRRRAQEIRERIGVQLQETQLNDKLQVIEVLRLFRSFYRRGRDPDEVCELVGLSEKRGSRYVQLSGGQKQRLALGCALVSKPEILFLDEPTTGLDPQARRRVWEVVEDFKSHGGTVLLTTHYMDEAESLSDHVVIVDHGKCVAEGTPQEMIRSLGAESVIEITAPSNGTTRLDDVLPQLEAVPAVRRARVDGPVLSLHVDAAHTVIPRLIETLEAADFALDDLRTHRPTLEDVFVALTGRHLRDG